MNYLVGLAFIAVAIIVMLFGERTVQAKGGVVLKVFSWPRSRASQTKWAIAAAFAGVGLWFIFVGVK